MTEKNITEKRIRFVLKKDEKLPNGIWRTQKIGNWHLFTDEYLPITEIKGRDNNSIGWILGYSVDFENSAFCPGKIIFNSNIG